MNGPPGGEVCGSDVGTCPGLEADCDTAGEPKPASGAAAVQSDSAVAIDSTGPSHKLRRNDDSYLDRFLSSFFDQKNIKWLLIIGAVIVFGSSLMLVTREWSHWPISMKYLTVLGYTAAGFFAAEISRTRLGLQITSTVLHGLTLLLLPVCFQALSWMSAGTARQPGIGLVQLFVLLAPAAALALFAGSRILDRLLNGRQTTFLVCYLMLCLAGCLPSAGVALMAFAMIAGLWMTFTVGVVKVNRHVFWLTEEHRTPRVFGFFPIALLGIQFLTLVCLKCLPAVPLQWLGFACVLVAFTVLSTARAVGDVFRQRTGDLVRPYPWSIVLPVFIGLALTMAGVVCSLNGFPGTYAVVPTAALAAVLMFRTAWELKHSGFVWLSLFFATAAYQFSPALFRDLALYIRDSAAAAVGEQKLPMAFYGVTYLPLLVATGLASRHFRRLGNTVFSLPLQHFTTLMSVVLFALSIENPKATLLVGMVNAAAFSWMARLFKDRRYALGSILAVYSAAFTLVPAVNGMSGLTLSPDMRQTVLAAVVALITLTRLPDCLLKQIPVVSGPSLWLFVRSDGTSRDLCQLSACGVGAVLLIAWLFKACVQFGSWMEPQQLLQIVLLLFSLGLYTLRHPRYLSGLVFWLVTAFAVLCVYTGKIEISVELLTGATIAATVAGVLGLAALWLAGPWKQGLSLGRIRRLLITEPAQISESHDAGGAWRLQTLAFAVPLCDVGLAIMCVLGLSFHLLTLLLTLYDGFSHFHPVSNIAVVSGLIGVGVVAKQKVSTRCGVALLPLLVSAATVAIWPSGLTLAWSWYPVLWVLTAAFCYWLARRQTGEMADDVALSSFCWLLLIITTSFLTLMIPTRIAAGVAFATFVVVDWRRGMPSSCTLLAIGVNLQLFLLAAQFSGHSGFVMSLLMTGALLPAIPLLLLSTALSIAVFDGTIQFFDRSLAIGWALLLRAAVPMLVLMAFIPDSYGMGQAAILLSGIGLTFAVSAVAAIRRQSTGYIWYSLGLPAMAALWMCWHGYIDSGAGTSRVILLGIATSCLVGARLCRGDLTFGIAERPLLLVGQSLPGLVAILGVAQAILMGGVLVPGFHTLAMFGAAAVYLHQAVSNGERRFALAALGIFNATLLLLCNSLGLTDVQFYMVPIGLSVIGLVELMQEQLPRASHNVLRYVGALTILVSPVFEILDGSWLHLLTLMVLSVVVVLLAIGLRVRALVHTGTAFLLADVVAMVVRSSIDHPNVLWICGVLFGAMVIGLAAFCENHRDRLLQRIRFLSAELATWR